MKLRTGVPFWPDRHRTDKSYDALDCDTAADIVIIGGGVTGALAARELCDAGADVLVLDAHEVASGSSAVSTGILLYDTDSSLAELGDRIGPVHAARAYHAGLEAIDRLEQLCLGLPDRCGFSRRSSLYIASKGEDVPALRHEYELRRACGLEIEWLERRELTRLGTIFAPAAILSRSTGEVDCYRLTHELIAQAAAAGARVHANSPVTRLTPDGTGTSVVTANGATVRARRVVCATGYEAALHLRRHTGNLASTWVVVSQPLSSFPGWPERCLVWETARPYLYLRSTDDGRLMAGGEDEPGAEAHRDPDRFPRKIAGILERVHAHLPEITVVPEYAYAGTFATTDDGLPFIGESPECPGVFYALGYGGNGITFSVVAAGILRALCLGRSHPDAALFGFGRHQLIQRDSRRSAGTGGSATGLAKRS